ncbi:MAG: bifunctional biotin--[acetyl-CoA-carboxylase] ligase/biotin operon repressor BirA [Pseudoxanthomonas suwonensis]|nr:bifunctional biotin--[acetyl-CoA-carboxylase] ligase/biotin operon repressor BirA [Pseudoxanthomonas suwonensis]
MGERALLQALAAGPVSGDALARDAGVTRAAMWKRIQALREAGVAIHARPGQGYRLEQPLQLLDADAIRAALPAAVQAQLASLDVAWSLDSTNAELLRRPVPASGHAVLLAERQSGGRGRRGRQWISPLAANLYLSVSRRFDGGLARLGGLSLVAGVACAEALQAAGIPGITLKWPNDVLLDGRKLGGLLVEGGGEHGGPVRAVIGIGLNVCMPVTQRARIDCDIGQPWADLSGLPQAPDRNRLAAAVLARLLPDLARFDREGLMPFLPRFAALDALQGRPITLLAGDGRRRHGRAVGLADDGALLVEVDGRVQPVHAGEVSVRGA